MKSFIIKFIIFSIPLIAAYIPISSRAVSELNTSHDYTLAIIDKHVRLNSVQSPKMIFAGGSNLAFGINSKKIEQEFKMPVVNLGLHAGLGLDFMLEELKQSINSGDVVFFSIEYYLEREGDYQLLRYTAAHSEEAGKYFDNNIVRNIGLNVTQTRAWMKKYFTGGSDEQDSKEDESVFTRAGFNEYGDVVAHLDKEKPKKLLPSTHFTYRYWEGIKALNEFNEYAKGKNVQVFFLYPSYMRSKYEENESAIQRLSNDLSNDLQIKILNTPTDFVFDDALFFDTVYHLTAAGREQRTDKLIEIIRQADKQYGFIPKN